MQIKTPFFPGAQVEVLNRRKSPPVWQQAGVISTRVYPKNPTVYFTEYDLAVSGRSAHMLNVDEGDVRKPTKATTKK